MKPVFTVALLLIWGASSVATAHASVHRPKGLARLMCSFQEPVCLHGSPQTPLTEVNRVSSAMEASLAALRTLGLPTHLADRGQGGSWQHDVYLSPTTSGAASHTDDDGPDGHFDKGSSFTLVQPGMADDCRLKSDVARAMAQAALLGLDPAGHRGVLAMGSSYLASLVAPCPALEAPAIAEFQRRPHRALTSDPLHTFSGSMMFPAHLDLQYGKDWPAKVWTSLYAFSAQATAPGEILWQNEPDFFDTLRLATNANGSTADELFLQFAIARAFVAPPTNQSSFPNLGYTGALGDVRRDWRVPITALPLRLAPSHPVQATGAAYIQVDIPPGHKGGLRLTADWESGLLMRWAVVKRDAAGHEILRHTAPGVRGRNYIQLSVVKLDKTASLLVVGTAIGSDDQAKPFDPDDGPPRRVSFVATLEHM